MLDIRPRIAADTYKRAPSGYVGRMRVSLQTIVNALYKPSTCLLRWLDAQQGYDEYAVSAMLIWAEAMEGVGMHHIACAALSNNAASWQEKGLVDIETICRAAVCLDGTSTIMKHTLVARFKTLLGRDLRRHDVDEELGQRTANICDHYYTNSDDTRDWGRWHASAILKMKQLFSEAFAMRPPHEQSLRNWWDSRVVWLPGGTASTKDGVKLPPKLMAGKQHTTSKKLMLSNVGASWITNALDSKPAIQARCATKNEPGLKRRPLRAADDVSYLLAAYASANIEKWLSINGMVMRQTPQDVAETTRHILELPRGTTILCMDYSDFNTGHPILLRIALSALLAKQYARHSDSEHAKAAAWVSLAHANHTVDGMMVNQGLSSGERDTARDNTLLHYVYSELVMDEVCAIGYNARQGFRRMCGDDEILVGVTWACAMTYYHEHVRQGHKLNPRKCMVSSECGEFLQYNMFTTGDMPVQPLCPNLINFVSGSWYKSANYVADEYPQQISEAAASCIRRGAKESTMMRITASSCNWLCSGFPWRDALYATNLYGAVKDAPIRSKVDNTKLVTALERHTTPAISDYLTMLCSRYDLSTSDVGVLRKTIEADLYTGALMANGVDLTTDPDETPQPATHQGPMPTALFTPTAAEKRALINNWVTIAGKARLDPKVWMAMLMNIPVKLIDMLGMDRVIKMVDNRGRAAYNSEAMLDTRTTIRPEFMAALPGAVAANYRVGRERTRASVHTTA